MKASINKLIKLCLQRKKHAEQELKLLYQLLDIVENKKAPTTTKVVIEACDIINLLVDDKKVK